MNWKETCREFLKGCTIAGHRAVPKSDDDRPQDCPECLDAFVRALQRLEKEGSTTVEEKIDEVLSLLKERPSAVVESLRVLNEDNHSYSMRPCATCKTISAALGEPFGCYYYQKKRSNHDRTR